MGCCFCHVSEDTIISVIQKGSTQSVTLAAAPHRRWDVECPKITQGNRGVMYICPMRILLYVKPKVLIHFDWLLCSIWCHTNILQCMCIWQMADQAHFSFVVGNVRSDLRNFCVSIIVDGILACPREAWEETSTLVILQLTGFLFVMHWQSNNLAAKSPQIRQVGCYSRLFLERCIVFSP